MTSLELEAMEQVTVVSKGSDAERPKLGPVLGASEGRDLRIVREGG